MAELTSSSSSNSSSKARAGGKGANVSGGLGSGSADGVVTSLAFRPDGGSQMENVLLAAQGDAVVHVHVGTRRVLSTVTEEGNKINTLAMRADGAVFASAGADGVVRAYDEASCSVCCTLDHGDGVATTGHTSHVFSLAWHPEDPQVLLSGGWDNRVLVWDLRVHR
ncbi:WD repeat domain-containing protein [Tetrabaena socialis]|uniref:WD repeat domain-containing protein n=1 Tax=Tetrabaena socialis TaxID=47790 RepID=A0A2J8AE15_9CHLO|nr:WD repeat domain-containing protein [Tetrabaena socialis]|eukprot:PNH10753.1 WD repeat domain-containing protein [Tetrabaena socialis]